MNDKITVAVRAWAAEKEISPADFARQCGYSYNHAFQMLKGEQTASVETIGRIAINYGADEVSEVLKRINPEQPTIATAA